MDLEWFFVETVAMMICQQACRMTRPGDFVVFERTHSDGSFSSVLGLVLDVLQDEVRSPWPGHIYCKLVHPWGVENWFIPVQAASD